MIAEGVDVSHFLLTSTLELGHALRGLEHKAEMISVYFDQGRNAFLTAILRVDLANRRFWFDPSSVPAINRAFSQAQHIVFAAAPDGVKIQFVVDGGVRLAEIDGAPAFEAAFPQDMVKLQRREYFRLETPIGKPLVCKLPHRNGNVINLPLHDISIGGMAMWMANRVDMAQMDIFPHCRVDLGTYGLIEVTVEIRSIRQVTKRDGSVQSMIGTCFVNLPRNTENLLQRYIAQLERERHQLLRGV